MEKLADLSTFESLLENDRQSTLSVFNPGPTDGSTVENTGINFDSDRIMPPKPIEAASNDSQFIPKWGQSLSKKVSVLEKSFDEMRSDITEIRSDITEIKQILTSKNK